MKSDHTIYSYSISSLYDIIIMHIIWPNQNMKTNTYVAVRKEMCSKLVVLLHKGPDRRMLASIQCYNDLINKHYLRTYFCGHLPQHYEHIII